MVFAVLGCALAAKPLYPQIKKINRKKNRLMIELIKDMNDNHEFLLNINKIILDKINSI